jgi:hypothetical protein
VLATLEKAAGVAFKLRRKKREVSRKLCRVIFAILQQYKNARRERAAQYISKSVRFYGIWRNWRDAGLQHIGDKALIQFCGFPLNVLLTMEQELLKDPALASLDRRSKYWKRKDPRACPACDVLDILVLALREPQQPDRSLLVQRAQAIESRWGLPASKWLRLLQALA